MSVFISKYHTPEIICQLNHTLYDDKLRYLCQTYPVSGLNVEIFQCYQPNFTTFLCLKKSICESALREDIVVVVIAFSEDGCIIPNQFELIHTDFLISILTRTDDIIPALNGCSDDINLYLLFLLWFCPPPLTDFTQNSLISAVLPTRRLP